MFNKYTLLIIFLLYLGFITYASLTTIESVGVDIAYADKFIHLFIYALFVVLLTFLLVNFKISHALVKAVCIALIYGTVIEVLQDKLTVSRHFDVLDILANVIGSLLAALIFILKKK